MSEQNLHGLLWRRARGVNLPLRMPEWRRDGCWKPRSSSLAAVLRGFGGPGLLAAYEAERRPVGLRNREGSRSHNETRRQIASLYTRDIYAEESEGDAARAAAAARIAEIGNWENECTGI